MSEHARSAPSQASTIITLTRDNIAEAAAGLPKKVALIMRAITRLKFGSLEINIPGKRTVKYQAPEPGPHGVATLHNWGIIRRLLTNGSMGVAESYIEGEWDSPDVTSFLELFLKNSYGGGAENFFNRNRLLAVIGKISH